MESQRQQSPRAADRFSRENYPRTFAARDACEDWIGVYAAEQAERYIAEGNNRTQRALAPCLLQIERSVERLCPVGIAAAPDLAPRCLVRSGYGPAGMAPAGITVLAVSPTNAYVLTLAGWPEVAGLERLMIRHKLRRTDAWIAITDLIESGNLVDLVRFIALWLGRDLAADVADKQASLRKDGLTPILVVMTVTHDECLRNGPLGAMQIIVLPAALELQLTEPHGAA
jgi:hypothetical protein